MVTKSTKYSFPGNASLKHACFSRRCVYKSSLLAFKFFKREYWKNKTPCFNSRCIDTKRYQMNEAYLHFSSVCVSKVLQSVILFLLDLCPNSLQHTELSKCTYAFRYLPIKILLQTHYCKIGEVITYKKSIFYFYIQSGNHVAES